MNVRSCISRSSWALISRRPISLLDHGTQDSHDDHCPARIIRQSDALSVARHTKRSSPLTFRNSTAIIAERLSEYLQVRVGNFRGVRTTLKDTQLVNATTVEESFAVNACKPMNLTREMATPNFTCVLTVSEIGRLARRILSSWEEQCSRLLEFYSRFLHGKLG